MFQADVHQSFEVIFQQSFPKAVKSEGKWLLPKSAKKRFAQWQSLTEKASQILKKSQQELEGDLLTTQELNAIKFSLADIRTEINLIQKQASGLKKIHKQLASLKSELELAKNKKNRAGGEVATLLNSIELEIATIKQMKHEK